MGFWFAFVSLFLFSLALLACVLANLHRPGVFPFLCGGKLPSPKTVVYHDTFYIFRFGGPGVECS